MTPRRIRWLRGMGVTLASLTRNPLGARYVGRPSRVGNPYRIYRLGEVWFVEGNGYRVGPPFTRRDAHAEAVAAFEETTLPYLREARLLVPLAGRDLACACPLDLPCHADVLLRAANPDLDPAVFRPDREVTTP